MLFIEEHPVQCMNGKCIYPCKNNLQQKRQFQNYNDLYGSENYEQGRFQHLGVPMLLVQIEEEMPLEEEKIHLQNDGVISDELFKKLFDLVKKKPKNRTTRKNRKKGKK